MPTANLFVAIDQDLNDALAQVAKLARTTKRAVVEATIADKVGTEHRERNAVRKAWADYRRTRPE